MVLSLLLEQVYKISKGFLEVRKNVMFTLQQINELQSRQ